MERVIHLRALNSFEIKLREFPLESDLEMSILRCPWSFLGTLISMPGSAYRKGVCKVTEGKRYLLPSEDPSKAHDQQPHLVAAAAPATHCPSAPGSLLSMCLPLPFPSLRGLLLPLVLGPEQLVL